MRNAGKRQIKKKQTIIEVSINQSSRLISQNLRANEYMDFSVYRQSLAQRSVFTIVAYVTKHNFQAIKQNHTHWQHQFARKIRHTFSHHHQQQQQRKSNENTLQFPYHHTRPKANVHMTVCGDDSSAIAHTRIHSFTSTESDVNKDSALIRNPFRWHTEEVRGL